jgi:uncharacterized protein (TIGR02001 family)
VIRKGKANSVLSHHAVLAIFFFVACHTAGEVHAAGIAGSATLTSDYIFRGISQSQGDPALQLDAHYASDENWLIGIWASTVRLNPQTGTRGEINAYASYQYSWNSDWTTKLTAVHYAYPWDAKELKYDYNELIGSLGFQDQLYITVAWSYDASRYSRYGYAQTGHAISYEAAYTQPVSQTMALNFGAGYYDLEGVVGTGYAFWNVGLGYDYRLWHVEGGYYGAQAKTKWLLGSENNNRFALTLIRRF